MHDTKKLIQTALSAIVFLSGCISIVFTQTLAKLFMANPDSVIRFTKKCFIVLGIGILNAVAPTTLRFTVDAAVPAGTFELSSQGQLEAHLSRRSVIIANHQIYTDWVFLWFLTYLSNLGGNVIIMLKDSLKKIPVLGTGMKNYNFIFLSRKWATDQETMGRQLDSIKGAFSLLMFPEGTNLSANTRNKTEAYAAKVGRKPFKHVLLPHTTGLKFALDRMEVDYVYDLTMGYSGVKPQEYGQDIYTLKNVFLKGKGPKIVDIHVKAYLKEDIPLDDGFEQWLFERWAEKDELMDAYYRDGKFPGQEVGSRDTEVAPREFASIFYVPVICAILLRYVWRLYKWLM